MVVVIVCNSIKMACMAWIAWKQDPEPLVTLGDAIASFITTPDKLTVGNCVAGKESYSNDTAPWLLPARALHESSGPLDAQTWKTGELWSFLPLVWRGRQRFWASAASTRRWALFCGL